MGDSEKRWQARGMRSPRESCNVPADFVIEGRVFLGMVKNKSDTGVFMEVLESFNVGQDIVMTFKIPGEKTPYKRKGRIARTERNGFGVQFD